MCWFFSTIWQQCRDATRLTRTKQLSLTLFIALSTVAPLGGCAIKCGNFLHIGWNAKIIDFSVTCGNNGRLTSRLFLHRWLEKLSRPRQKKDSRPAKNSHWNQRRRIFFLSQWFVWLSFLFINEGWVFLFIKGCWQRLRIHGPDAISTASSTAMLSKNVAWTLEFCTFFSQYKLYIVGILFIAIDDDHNLHTPVSGMISNRTLAVFVSAHRLSLRHRHVFALKFRISLRNIWWKSYPSAYWILLTILRVDWLVRSRHWMRQCPPRIIKESCEQLNSYFLQKSHTSLPAKDRSFVIAKFNLTSSLMEK